MSRTRGSRLAQAIALLLLIILPVLLPDWLGFLLTIAFAKAIVVLGVVVLLRSNLVSFGHGLYFAAGAYTVGFAMKWLNMREAALLLPLGLLLSTMVAAVIGLFLSRYRGIFFGMLTLGFSMILYSLLLKLYSITGGTDGMVIKSPTIFGFLPARNATRLAGHYYATLASLVLALALARRWAGSPLGYLATAIRDNEIRVEYMGASAWQSIYYTYILSGALGGLGGGLVALTVGHIAPEFSYWTQSSEFVFVTLLGGYTSVFAPVLGSVVFEFVRSYAYALSPSTWQMTLGVILLAIILFLPQGLWSLRERPVGWAKWTSSSRR
jgi:branched-chain amino acid transport system permease protein